MSKCDLQITFDRADRRYRGGQEVTGTVRVQVNQDVPCKGIVLEHFWQTHGRGNTATGRKQTSLLHQGELRAGELLSFPFRVTAPAGPPTYHGRYINVDHYLNVRVDIPWAIDPKAREDYILVPGSPNYGCLPLEAGQLSNLRGLLKHGVPIGVAMIVLGLFFACPLGIVLIPAGIIFLFFALRKPLAEKRIGKVRLLWRELAVAPGGHVPVQMSFTPRQSSRLSRITAKLMGKERCVSGSGKNKSTHTHTFYEKTETLASACDLTAGQPIRLEGRIPIPRTEAFSFHAKDNRIFWELEVRVDIPLWPDWVEKSAVTVRPAVEAEIVEPEAVAEATALPAAEVERPPEEAEIAGPTPATEPPRAAEPTQPEPPVVEEPRVAAATDPALVAVIGRLSSASRYSREREEIINEHSEQSFDCAVEVEKVERTYSYIPDERFRKGRTATGTLRGTDCKVQVQLPDARNEELDAMRPGSVLQTSCRLLKWNTIYDRLEMREA